MTVEMGDVNYLRHFSYFYIKYDVWSRMQNLHEFLRKRGLQKKQGLQRVTLNDVSGLLGYKYICSNSAIMGKLKRK